MTEIELKGALSPGWLEATDDAVWVADAQANTVTRVDPATNRVVATIPVGRAPADGVVGPDGLVWIPIQGDGTVARIDPETNRVAGSIRVGKIPFVARRAFGDMWISNFGGTQVWRVRVSGY